MSDDAYDLGAEQSLLGSVLRAPATAGPALLSIPEVDPQLVLVDLMARRGFGADTGPYLLTLLDRAWTPANSAFYAERVLHCAARRNIAGAATRIRQRLEQSWINGGDEPIRSFTAELRAACDDAEQADAGIDGDEPSLSLADLLNTRDEHDWLVPGLLERGERIIITGSEGLGKSFVISQFAACLAAGMHPFTATRLGSGGNELQVLVVDCENGLSQSRRRFRQIVQRLEGGGDEGWRKNLRIELRPNGLNLLGSDAAWLERKVATNTPDLLVVGPLYRLHYANMNDELAARELVAVLDGIRTRHGCALLSEAHPGHAEDQAGERRMRPAGSSLFMRWPEFGFGLRRAKGADGEHPSLVDVVAWRGSREQRQWPRQLKYGRLLPWEPANADYWEEAA
jgi:hypothetical protein